MRRRLHTRRRTARKPHRRTRRERDASSGWRDEYRTQATPLPDGGDVVAGDYDLPAPGDRVRDRDGDDELLVVDTFPTATASGWYVDEIDATLAEVNQEYDAGAPVVRGVYYDDLEALDGWRSLEDVRDALSFDAIRAYDFPADRLAGDASGGGPA